MPLLQPKIPFLGAISCSATSSGQNCLLPCSASCQVLGNWALPRERESGSRAGRASIKRLMHPVPRRYPVCRDVAPYLLLGPAWLPREPRPTRPPMTGPGRRRHSKARASRLACPGRREHAGRAGPYALRVRRSSPLRRLATPRPARPVPGPVARLSVAMFWWRAVHVLN